MKTILLKSFLFTISLCSTIYCNAQKQNTRTVYEYELIDSGQEKKEMKLIEIKTVSYNELQPYYIDSNILSSSVNTTLFQQKDQTIKDALYTYQCSFERKSATIKKFDNSNKNLLSVRNIYFGFNNRISDEIVVDEKTKHKETKRFLYDRKGRLAKIVSYKNGKVKGYILYEYKIDSVGDDFTNL